MKELRSYIKKITIFCEYIGVKKSLLMFSTELI